MSPLVLTCFGCDEAVFTLRPQALHIVELHLVHVSRLLVESVQASPGPAVFDPVMKEVHVRKHLQKEIDREST